MHKLIVKMVFPPALLLLAVLVVCGSLPPIAAAAEGGDRAMLLLDQGEFAAAAGNFDRAQQLWQEALTVKPNWATAQNRLKELPARRRSYPAHLEDIRVHQKASLDYVEAVNLFNQGRYGEAATLLESVLQVQPDHPSAGMYLDYARTQVQLATHGSLRIEANIPAQIFLNGELKGITPLLLENLPVGSYSLVAEAHGVRVMKIVTIKGRTAHATAFAFREVEGQ